MPGDETVRWNSGLSKKALNGRKSVYWVAATGVVDDDDDVVVVVVAGVLRWLKTGLKSLSWMTIAPRVEGRIR